MIKEGQRKLSAPPWPPRRAPFVLLLLWTSLLLGYFRMVATAHAGSLVAAGALAVVGAYLLGSRLAVARWGSLTLLALLAVGLVGAVVCGIATGRAALADGVDLTSQAALGTVVLLGFAGWTGIRAWHEWSLRNEPEPGWPYPRLWLRWIVGALVMLIVLQRVVGFVMGLIFA